LSTLYPLKFKPIYKPTIWGGSRLEKILDKKECPSKCGESWEISGVEGNISEVENGFLEGNTLQELIEIYMGELVGDAVYEKFGCEFPLLIKYIDANDALSIQVHPDDAVAKHRHNAYGKTEMWYVIDADSDSTLISGFKEDSNQEEFLKALTAGNLQDLLNYEKVKTGDVFFLPAGRIHAIGKGILLAEMQQTSDITYRVYDWDRKDDQGNGRELHTNLAVDVLDYKKREDYKTDYKSIKNEAVTLADCKYFKTNLLEFDYKLELDYALVDSFVVYMCVEGALVIDYGTGKLNMVKGETVLIPADMDVIHLIPEENSKVLEVYL